MAWKSGIILLFCLFCSSSCNKLDDISEIRGEIKKLDVEGVLLKVEQEEGMDVLVFEGERVFVHLGSHKAYPGEWNYVRLNPRGYVEEIWLGEDWREQHE